MITVLKYNTQDNGKRPNKIKLINNSPLSQTFTNQINKF